MKALVFRGPNHIGIEEVPIPRPDRAKGCHSGKLSIPLEPFAAGLGNHKIITTLCPGSKERMQRLMRLVLHGRLDLRPLLTHTFPPERITEADKLFGERRDQGRYKDQSVLKLRRTGSQRQGRFVKVGLGARGRDG